MAIVRITGITLSCTPLAQFNTLIEYKLTSDVGWTSAGNKLTNTNGTFVTPLDISGLVDGECYDFRFTAGIANSCPYTEEFCLAPSPIWISLATECETEGGFGEVKQITGLASPATLWWDPVQEFLYVMDIDDPAGNVYWFTDISTATTVADATHSAAVSFDPIWAMAVDETNRRLLLAGDNTGGLIVYDVDTDTSSTVAYGSNGAFFRTTVFLTASEIICNDFLTNIVIINRTTLTVTSTIPIAGLTNPEHFDNGPFTLAQSANGNIYVVSNNADAATLGCYDTAFNHIAEITLPGVATWTFGNYWMYMFYDPTSDLLFISDTGSNQRFVVDPNTNTVLDQRTYTNLEDRSNASFSFSVDPLTDTFIHSFKVICSSINSIDSGYT